MQPIPTWEHNGKNLQYRVRYKKYYLEEDEWEEVRLFNRPDCLTVENCRQYGWQLLTTSLTHWHMIRCHWTLIVNMGSGNGLLPDGTKPLPELMLTYSWDLNIAFSIISQCCDCAGSLNPYSWKTRILSSCRVSLLLMTWWRKEPGSRLNIKMLSYQYRYSHVKDKTVSSTVLSLTRESSYGAVSKMLSFQYRDPHAKDEKVSWPSYL